jgi:uncharacterized protein with NRDE domain
MCTVVILRRPDHRWPLVLAANRDEMIDRPWKPPARHWSDRPDVIAGLDELGRGTWLGLNDFGVVAAVLNRLNTLGPAPGLRSRGELPLEALDHAEARAAAEAIADIDPRAYRPFNMIVGDCRQVFWIRARHGGNGRSAGEAVEVSELPPGTSMITAYDLNDTNSPRIRRYLPRFEAAQAPDPATGDWSAWKALLASGEHDPGAGPGGAVWVATDTGFGTVSSSLIALPAAGRSEMKPVWLFAPDNPGENNYAAVCM